MPPLNSNIDMDIQFVNRADEVRLVQDIIQDIHQGHAALKRIINFYGVRGIGKTCLLRHLYDRAPSQAVRTLFVEFKSVVPFSSEKQRIQIIRDILKQADNLITQDKIVQLEGLLENPENDYSIPFQEILIDLINSLASREHQTPVSLLMLFDSTDQADEEILKWLEDHIIVPCIHSDRVVIVLAGRKQINWKKFDVNRRVIPCQLEPFDSETVGAQLPLYASLASEIASLTFGHPLASEQLALGLKQIEQQTNRTFSQDDFEIHKKELLQYLFERLIDRQILNDVQSDVRLAIRSVAILRQFDINALRHLLGSSNILEFRDKPGVYFLDLIAKMVDCGLVRWDSNQKGYAVDKSIRRMLFLHKYHTEREDFIRMNEEAAKLYQLWIEKLPENRVRSIIERLFHLANMMSAQNMERAEIALQLSQELRAYLRQYSQTEYGLRGIMTLREELHEDREFWELVPVDSKRLDNIISEYMPKH